MPLFIPRTLLQRQAGPAPKNPRTASQQMLLRVPPIDFPSMNEEKPKNNYNKVWLTVPCHTLSWKYMISHPSPHFHPEITSVTTGDVHAHVPTGRNGKSLGSKWSARLYSQDSRETSNPSWPSSNSLKWWKAKTLKGEKSSFSFLQSQKCNQVSAPPWTTSGTLKNFF